MAPLSKAALAKRAAKAKATREAKKKAALEQLGLDSKRKKIRKPRKPMTAEQKAAAAERLAKAREARGPAKNLQYAENVRLLPDDDPFSLVNVKSWLKTQKEFLKGLRGTKNSKEASERKLYNETFTYVTNLEAYLRHGVYSDHRAGENAELNVQLKCVKMAYYKDGTPKRTQGVYYPDLGEVYEGE